MLSPRATFFFVLFFGCAASQSAPVEPWRLELASSGGIHGRGTGTYSIDSEGAVGVANMTGQRCEVRASDATMRRFREALAAAKPERWSKSYRPENSCCDRYEWSLTLDQAEKKTTTEWVEPPEPMPKDLAALVEAFRLLREEYDCR